MHRFVSIINDIADSERDIAETIIRLENIPFRGQDYQVGDLLSADIDSHRVRFEVSETNSLGQIQELIILNPVEILGLEDENVIHDLVSETGIGTGARIKLMSDTRTVGSDVVLDWDALQSRLTASDAINVTAYYNNDGTFIYFEDDFLQLLSGDEYVSLTTDEAQRIKMVTYYTFKSIPLESNRRILINYRVYSN
jgi:hypothetical protein